MTRGAEARTTPVGGVPDWDRKAVARPYLIALRQQAEHGAFDAEWVDAVLQSLVAELRETYHSQDVERALQGLNRVFANIEGVAARARQDAGMVEAALDPGAVTTITHRRRRVHDTDAFEPKHNRARDGLEDLIGWVHSAALRTQDVLVTWWRGRLENWAEEAKHSSLAPTVHRPAKQEPLLSVPTEPGYKLNGPALHKSIVPTWMMLVGLSWVSLLWGGFISVPFGVGIGIFATIFVGFVAVPVWGTVFGFLGMGAVRTSMLSEMGFKPLPADDPLAQKAAAFAADLGIPAPKLGTVDVYNAFAMGTSHQDATVAIGKPLIERFSADEVAAILGHEMGHVVSGDMRRMMLMRTFQNATVWYMVAQRLKLLARWVICWGAELAILSFSRRREYWADAIGAALAGKETMISALKRMSDAPELSTTESTHARFMFRGRFVGLFSTHPTMEARIAALRDETYLRQLPVR
jgi:heat shock protein HtpX